MCVVASIRDLGFTVLVVKDGSADKTDSEDRKGGAEVVSFDKNKGKANAIKIGMNYLRERSLDRVITLDADLQHLPEEIPELLKPDADIIIGARRKDRKTMPLRRRLDNYLATKIAKRKIGLKVGDPLSGFRVYTKKSN